MLRRNRFKSDLAGATLLQTASPQRGHCRFPSNQRPIQFQRCRRWPVFVDRHIHQKCCRASVKSGGWV